MSPTLPQLLLRKVERWMSHMLACRDTEFEAGVATFEFAIGVNVDANPGEYSRAGTDI